MQDLSAWIALKTVPGIGNHLYKRLIDQFQSPENIFEASIKKLLEVEGMSERLAHRVKTPAIQKSISKELDLVVRKGYHIITLSDPEYPSLLQHIPDPPPFLYVYGSLPAGRKYIAVVGSRNATRYGVTITQKLCRDLTALGFTIVSGMARGIDSAAHVGALMGKGKTVAVLGSGLERIYPRENRELYHRIAAHGAVVSEFPLHTEPEAFNFPIRNRIISGLSLGTVIVEATPKSGSLITARLAAEQNREVFAVPGSVQSFKSTGTHRLLKQGAKLVEHVQDIVEELPLEMRVSLQKPPATPRKPPSTLSSDEKRIFEVLEPYPIHIDNLGRKIAMDPGRLSSILLELELKGMVQQHPGKLFSINEEIY